MRRADLGLALGLWVAALAIRLPYLTLIPRYTDEGNDVLWGLAIALGRHLPLTSSDPYNGPLTSYLIAIVFRLFGVNLLWPRLVVAIGGATLVVVVYWLARRMGGQVAGLLAASLTLLHPILVTFTSHHAFTSSQTPLFATLTMATAWEGVQRRSVAWFAATGLCAALTLHTHPTSAVGLAGLALWLIAQPALRPPLRQTAFAAGLGLFLLGYAPMLAANLRPASPMLAIAQERDYAFGLVTSVPDYVTRLIGLVRYMAYAIGGIVAPGSLWIQLMASLVAVLLLAALVYAWRRGQSLLPLIFLATALLLPLVLRGYSSRYLGGLLPAAHVALGLLGASVLHTYRRPAVAVGVVSLWGGLLALSSATIATHYQVMEATGVTNRGYVQLTDALRDQAACGERLHLVYPDAPDTDQATADTAVILRAIHYVLTLQGCTHIISSPQTVQAALAAGQQPFWVIQSPATPVDPLNAHPILTVQLPTLTSVLVPITLVVNRGPSP